MKKLLSIGMLFIFVALISCSENSTEPTESPIIDFGKKCIYYDMLSKNEKLTMYYYEKENMRYRLVGGVGGEFEVIGDDIYFGDNTTRPSVKLDISKATNNYAKNLYIWELEDFNITLKVDYKLKVVYEIIWYAGEGQEKTIYGHHLFLRFY
jgi:hypothetical protein